MRAWILPDWWDDKTTETGSGMAMMEGYVARGTGLSIEKLRDSGPLSITPTNSMRFKKRADCEELEVAPAAAIAQQVARGLVKAVEVPAQFKGTIAACEARQHILKTWDTPSLEALVDFAWDHGVIVAHLAELPGKSKKFDGLAMFADDRPVIVLASRRDSPAWLAFHLAHELAHILLGHVTPETAPLSDSGLESTEEEDPLEIEANRFALELLTGDSEPSFDPVYGLTGKRLANQAQRLGPENSVDPGVLALVYGWSANRLPAAQNALNFLDLNSGGHQTIASGVRRHLKDDLPESLRLLVNLVTEL